MLTKRLEVLFDPGEFKILKKKAEEDGKSIAFIVREAVKEKIIDSSLMQKQKALKKLFSSGMETPFDEWKEEKKRITKSRVKDIETY